MLKGKSVPHFQWISKQLVQRNYICVHVTKRKRIWTERLHLLSTENLEKTYFSEWILKRILQRILAASKFQEFLVSSRTLLRFPQPQPLYTLPPLLSSKSPSVFSNLLPKQKPCILSIFYLKQQKTVLILCDCAVRLPRKKSLNSTCRVG